MTSNTDLYKIADKSSKLLREVMTVFPPDLKTIRQALNEARACNAALQTLERNLTGVIPPKEGE